MIRNLNYFVLYRFSFCYYVYSLMKVVVYETRSDLVHTDKC